MGFRFFDQLNFSFWYEAVLSGPTVLLETDAKMCKYCRAVVEHSEGRNLPGVVVANFHAIPGAGVAASVIQAEVNFSIWSHRNLKNK